MTDREPRLSRTVTDESLADVAPEPPIVARCVVEVRSDGSLSIARGVFEHQDERVVIEGVGRTPRELLSMLARGAFAHARTRLADARQNLELRLPPLALARRIARPT